VVSRANTPAAATLAYAVAVLFPIVALLPAGVLLPAWCVLVGRCLGQLPRSAGQQTFYEQRAPQRRG
jgi:Na+-transporting methylmalonyl-CoA/oxaloacetate decarboxylase beta subunit